MVLDGFEVLVGLRPDWEPRTSWQSTKLDLRSIPAQVTRSCAYCRENFQQLHGDHRCCSDRCARKMEYRESRREVKP